MDSNRPRLWMLATLAGMLFIAAPAAEAATTVGSSLRQRANLYVRCASGCTDVQIARPGGASLAVPSGGVLTTWRVRVASTGTVRLRILRPRDDGTLEVIASSDPQRLTRRPAPGKDVLYTFAARLGVRRGDRLALDRDRTAGAVFHTYGADTTWRTSSLSPPAEDGERIALPGSGDAGRELLLNAAVEADADDDGFGDETQDRCPEDAARQETTGCANPAGAQAPGTGETPAPVDVGGAPSAPGRGPLIRGEPATTRRPRRHRARPAPRSAPTVSPTRPGSHGERPSPRRRPRSERPADEQHGRRPGARRTPRRTRTGSDRHGAGRPRPETPRRVRRPAGDHPSRPARPAPRRGRRTAPSGHSDRSTRPAPRRVRSPRRRSHRPRPRRPAPGT